MNPLLQVFFEEANELLAESEQALILLEDAPNDAQLLNRIFRCAHTLKGNSAMLGFERVTAFTHALEDLLVLLRSGARAVTPPVITMLLAAQDGVRALLTNAQEGDAEPPEAVREQTAQLLVAIRAHIDNVAPPAPPSAPPPPPAVPVARAEPIAAKPASATALATVVEAAPPKLPALAQPRLAAVAVAEAPAAPPQPRAAEKDEARTLRVNVEKIDRLINLVGELVITQSMISQSVNDFTPEKLTKLKEALAEMDRHARELHERVMAVRMVPLRYLFGRFPRLVRDLAAAVGKQVDLEVIGGETELDRTVIERISDPLTHLIRNAVDHGVELTEERERAGKPPIGTVRVEAYQQGGSIYLEVSDDGRGLDRERILAKARTQGLVPSDQDPSEEEVFALIFAPGFSTAEQVTAISGRGVGMDVVKRNLEVLGGTCAIRSTPGEGTLFQIKLPLTVAILDGQLVRVGDQVYVVPLLGMLESVQPRAGWFHRVAQVGEVVVIRGKTLPLLRLHRLFGVPTFQDDPARGLLIVIEHDNQEAAVLVDDILGQQQVVIKSLEANYQKVEGIGGATILGDGHVALILDVAGVMSLARAARRTDQVVA